MPVTETSAYGVGFRNPVEIEMTENAAYGVRSSAGTDETSDYDYPKVTGRPRHQEDGPAAKDSSEHYVISWKHFAMLTW